MTKLPEIDRLWQERQQVLKKRCDWLATALLGAQAAESWWTSANRAFEGHTPQEHFQHNPEQVYSYLMSYADGSYH